MEYKKLLDKFEHIFWQLREARSQIIYYHLLYDYDTLREAIKQEIKQKRGQL